MIDEVSDDRVPGDTNTNPGPAESSEPSRFPEYSRRPRRKSRRKRAWIAAVVSIMAVAGIVGYTVDSIRSGPFSEEQLRGAHVDASWQPPVDWLVVPGQNPDVRNVSGIPDRAIGYEVQASTDNGDTWRGFPYGLVYFGSYSTRQVSVDEAWVSENDYLFRIRWIGKGPSVSPWSSTRVVKSASSVPESCLTAMQDAAKVPEDQDNNPELLRALNSCETMEEWLTALYMTPGARDYTVNTRDEIDPAWEVDLMCDGGPLSNSRACASPALGVYADYKMGLGG